jgi:hypothetical protein
VAAVRTGLYPGSVQLGGEEDDSVRLRGGEDDGEGGGEDGGRQRREGPVARTDEGSGIGGGGGLRA